MLFKKHTILLFLLLLLFWDIGQLADLLSLMTSMIKDAQRGAVQQKIGEQKIFLFVDHSFSLFTKKYFSFSTFIDRYYIV